MPDETVRTELREGVTLIRIDDGKANGLSSGVIAALNQALDRAEKEASAAVIAGREGRFSGGFDLATMRSGPEAVRALVTEGAQLLLRIHESRLPVVAACTGHAVAAGAILLLVSDARIGAGGAFKIGLNEVAIGMALPIFGVEFARHRVSKRHFIPATTQARLYAPNEAVDAGFLDRVVAPEEVVDAACAEAARLGALPQPGFGLTKRNVNGGVAATIRATLDEDLAKLTGPG
jgi:enoyl-CoA hydratase